MKLGFSYVLMLLQEELILLEYLMVRHVPFLPLVNDTIIVIEI